MATVPEWIISFCRRAQNLYENNMHKQTYTMYSNFQAAVDWVMLD